MVLEMVEGIAFDNVPNGVYNVTISETEENAKIGEWENRNRITVTIVDGEHEGKVLNRYFGRLSTGSLLNNEILKKAGIEIGVGEMFELYVLEGYFVEVTVVNKKGKQGGMFSNIVSWDNFIKPTKKGKTKTPTKQKHIAGKEKAEHETEYLICTQCGKPIMPNSTYHVDEDGNMFHDQYGKRCRDAYVKAMEEAEKPKKKGKK